MIKASTFYEYEVSVQATVKRPKVVPIKEINSQHEATAYVQLLQTVKL